MADLTLVQGVADLRLSEATLRRDLDQARRLILNTIRQLERDTQLIMRIRIDDRNVQTEVRRIQTRIADALGTITIPVEFDTAAAVVPDVERPLDVDTADVDAADVDVEGGVTVPVAADTTEARADIIRLISDAADDSITLPVRAEVQGSSELQQLANQLDEAARTFGERRIARVTGEADFSGITSAIDDVTSRFDTFRAPLTLDVDRTGLDRLADRADEAITLQVEADTDPARAAIERVTEPETVTVDVEANTAQAEAKVEDLGGKVIAELDLRGGDATPETDQKSLLLPSESEVARFSGGVIGTAETFGERIRDGLRSVTNINDDLLGTADRLDESFRTFGERRLRPGRLIDEVESITVTVDADTTPLQASLQAIESQDESITVPVDGDTAPAQAAITAVERTDVEDLSVTILGDSDPVQATIAAVENQDVESVTVQIEGDATGLRTEINALQNEADALQRRIAVLNEGIELPPSPPIGGFLPPIGEFERAGDDAGRQFGRRMIGALRGVFTTGAVAAGGFLGLSLVRGFNRFTTIRDSVASLTVQLQDAAAAGKLLDEVLDVVTGTPFNLDQFAEAASNMVAFGIEAEKIPDYLTAISEVAATRGGRANEYAQRLAISFGQVAVQGRITNDEVQQLALTGVPALQILGNSIGETTFETRELISKGLLPANEALDALTKGILEGSDGLNGATVSFAGTAEALRETLTGSIGGFKSATARFGVSIIEPLEGILVDGFTGAAKAVDRLGATVKESLGGLAVSDEMLAIRDFLGELPEFAETAVDAFRGLGPALSPLLVVLGGAGLGQIATLLGPLGAFLPQITTPIGALTAAVTTLIATTPELREDFVPILRQLGETGATVAVVLGDGLREGTEAAIPILRKLFDVVDELLPVLDDLAVGGAGLLAGFADALGLLATALNAIPTPVLTAVVGALGAYAALRLTAGPLLRLADGLTRIGAATIGLPARLQQTNQGLAVFRQQADLAQRSAARASAGIAGAFSGIALASDDMATQVTGAVGALSSVALGFAYGGPLGAGIAAIGAGVGVIAGEFINARQEAEEFARAVTASADQIIDELSDVEIAAGQIRFDSFEIRQDDQATQDFIDALGEDLFAQLQAIPGFDLNDLLDVDVDQIDPTIAALDALRTNIDELASLDLRETALLDFDPTGRLPESFLAVAEALGAIRQEGESLADFQTRIEATDPALAQDIVAARVAAEEYNALLDERAAIVQQLGSLDVPVPGGVEEIGTMIELLERFGTATEAERDRLEALREIERERLEIREENIRKELELQGARGKVVDDIIAVQRRLEDVSAQDLVDIGALDGAGVAAAIIADEIERAKEGGEDLTPPIVDAKDATEAWAEQIELVTARLDQTSSVLDRLAGAGDAAAALRGIGEGLNEIINEDELRKAEQIADQVERQLERVEDASDRLERERLEFSFNEQIALQNIAEAEAAGATKGALAARRDLERDRLEIDQLAEDLAEEEAKLADLQAQAVEFGSVSAVTFGDVLRQQAAGLGISLFDLIVFEQPTAEAQQAFQQFVEQPVQVAIAQIEQRLSEGDFSGAAELAEQFSGDFFDRWSAIFGSERADELVNDIFNFDDVKVEALARADVQEFLGYVQDGFSAASAFEMSTNLSSEDFATGEMAQFHAIVQGLLDDTEFTTAVGLDDESVALMQEELRAALSSQIDLIVGPVRITGTGDAVRSGPGTAFRYGGIVEPHDAHIAKSIRIFGEPETGGEAYIPLTAEPLQRRRSTALLTDVAERFGLTVLPGPVSITTEAADRFAPVIDVPRMAAPIIAVDARPELAGLANAVADGVGRAMTRSQKSNMARDYAEAVHIEHLHIGSGGNDRRTARRVVRELADLSLRRRR